jgi:hypothetical protein
MAADKWAPKKGCSTSFFNWETNYNAEIYKESKVVFFNRNICCLRGTGECNQERQLPPALGPPEKES